MTCSAARAGRRSAAGAPSGISTLPRICHSVMPIARAASMVRRSTDSSPAYAPASSGGIAEDDQHDGDRQQADAGEQDQDRQQSRGSGSARATLPTRIATPRPVPVCPMASPIGTAITTAMSDADSAVAEVLAESRGSDAVARPDQWAGSKIHANASTKRFTAHPPSAGADASRRRLTVAALRVPRHQRAPERATGSGRTPRRARGRTTMPTIASTGSRAGRRR